MSDWIVYIDDISEYSKFIHQLIIDNKINQVRDLLPKEKPYPLPDNIALNIIFV